MIRLILVSIFILLISTQPSYAKDCLSLAEMDFHLQNYQDLISCNNNLSDSQSNHKELIIEYRIMSDKYTETHEALLLSEERNYKNNRNWMGAILIGLLIIL